jgi:Hydrolases of the alpha/beta superfamily
MKYWILAFALVGFSFFALIRWIIPSLVFHPTKEIVATPSDIGLEYEEVRLQTPDGETITGWHIPAAPKVSEPGQEVTMLFFHGNAGNISHRMESIAFFHTLGLSVFIIDYRGFGESSGKPSVRGTIQDARTAWQWLTEQKRVPASSIILFGRSLGGGVAAALAAEVTPKAFILESTFTSLHDMGKEMFRWAPGIVFIDEYATVNNIKNLQIPLLVVHSPEDEVVLFRMGREIFDSYNGPKTFLQIRGSHNGGWISDLAVYEKGIRDFMEKMQFRLGQ